jgi:hypothetical protein
MDVTGVPEAEQPAFAAGITWPALIVGTSTFRLGDHGFRHGLIAALEPYQDKRGFMHFFRHPDLQRRYPPDLESTSMWVAARAVAGLPVTTDLDEIRGFVRPDGLIETWVSGRSTSVDFTSQLIMWLCMQMVGQPFDSVMGRTVEDKMSTYDGLVSPDAFYQDPLLFIYFSLFIPDRSVFPSVYVEHVGRFVKSYVPKSDVEVLMIDKICNELGLAGVRKQPVGPSRPFFTNGKRQHIQYRSGAVADGVMRNSALRAGVELLKADR